MEELFRNYFAEVRMTLITRGRRCGRLALVLPDCMCTCAHTHILSPQEKFINDPEVLKAAAIKGG